MYHDYSCTKIYHILVLIVMLLSGFLPLFPQFTNTDLLTIGDKYNSFGIGVNSGRKLSFAGPFSCIISVDGGDMSSYGAFFVQGYGIGVSRMHIAVIQAGDSITCTLMENEEAVYIRNTSTGVNISILMMNGALPAIST